MQLGFRIDCVFPRIINHNFCSVSFLIWNHFLLFDLPMLVIYTDYKHTWRYLSSCKQYRRSWCHQRVSKPLLEFFFFFFFFLSITIPLTVFVGRLYLSGLFFIFPMGMESTNDVVAPWFFTHSFVDSKHSQNFECCSSIFLKAVLSFQRFSVTSGWIDLVVTLKNIWSWCSKCYVSALLINNAVVIFGWVKRCCFR